MKHFKFNSISMALISIGVAISLTPTAYADGIDIGSNHYTDQQIKDFYAGGGNDVQFMQQNGITDPWQIHDLAGKARVIGGAPTGEAAMQSFFKQYQQYNPHGVFANDYAGWANDQAPDVANAMRAGAYTGPAVAPKDYDFGGIYGPGSAVYGKPGYASGMGPRGDGGDWDSTPAPGAGGAVQAGGNAMSGNSAPTTAQAGQAVAANVLQPGTYSTPTAGASAWSSVTVAAPAQ